MRLDTGIQHLTRTVVRAALVAAVLIASGCGNGPITPTPPGPPALTCPASVSLSGVLGGTQSVTYTPPTLTGGAPPVTTTCAPSSGSTFPTGDTTVTCTATDAQSRQAACSFSVTLRPVTLNVRTFVAFGDSVTAGQDGRRLDIRFGFVDPLKAYPALLQSILATDFPDQGAVVVNEGEGGARVKDDVQRLPIVLQRHQPEVLLLLHGYNDLANDGVSAVDEVVTALRTNVRTARGRGVQHVFVSTLTPSRPATGWFNRTIDPLAIQQTNTKIVPMAMMEGAHVVDAHAAFLGRVDQLVEEDGLHLTFAGNQVLAETFYAAIRAAGLTSTLK